MIIHWLRRRAADYSGGGLISVLVGLTSAPVTDLEVGVTTVRSITPVRQARSITPVRSVVSMTPVRSVRFLEEG